MTPALSHLGEPEHRPEAFAELDAIQLRWIAEAKADAFFAVV